MAGSISVDRDLTSIALLRLLTAASTFWLALQLSRDVDAGALADLVGGGDQRAVMRRLASLLSALCPMAGCLQNSAASSS